MKALSYSKFRFMGRRAKSKIDRIRDEIERIGAWTPDIFKPRLDVSWHFSHMIVIGKRTTSIPYELLLEVLKSVATGAGEDEFWKAVDSTDFDALYERLSNEQLADWKNEDRLAKRRANQRKAKRKKETTHVRAPKKKALRKKNPIQK